MKKSYLFVFAIVALIVSCKVSRQATNLANIKPKHSLIEAATAKTTDPNQIPGAGVALAFMNSYVVFCDERGASSVIAWVERSQHVAQNFKTAFTSLHEEARIDDPEVG